MALPWAQVKQSPQYRALSPADKLAAKQQYFDQVVVPQLDPADVDAAHEQFFNLAPVAPTPAKPAQPQQPEPLADRAKRAVETAAQSDVATGIAQQGGVAARGVMGLPAMLAQGAEQLWNWTTPAQAKVANAIGLDRVTPEMLQIQPQNMALNNLYATTTRAGEPTGGRLAEAGIGALTGAGVAGAVSRAAPAGRVMLKNMADTMAQRPGLQVVSGVTGAAAAEGAKELGAGPIGQTAAALAGAMVPAGAGVAAQKLFRGATTPAQVSQNISDYRAAGVNEPTAGMVTDANVPKTAEALSAPIPLIGDPLVAAAKGVRQGFNDKVEQLAGKLGPEQSEAQLGEAITAATGRDASGFIGRGKAIRERLYDRFGAMLPKNTLIETKNTLDALDNLTRPVAGGENLTSRFVPEKFKQIKADLEADILNNARKSVTTYGAQGGKGVPYEAIKKIRTDIGEMLANPAMLEGGDIAKLKAMYAALSRDMGDAATATGNPKTIDAWKRADKFNGYLNDKAENVIEPLVKNRTPEQIYAYATSKTDMKSGATKIKQIFSVLPREQQDATRAMFLRRLGEPDKKKGEFDPTTYLRNWGGMHEDAKTAMFGSGEFRKDLDIVADKMRQVQEGSRFLANPSGTEIRRETVGTGFATIGSAYQAGQGNVGSAIMLALPAVSAAVSARLLTNQKFVKWLATNLQAPQPTAVNGAVNALVADTADEDDQTKADVQEYVDATKTAASSPNTSSLTSIPQLANVVSEGMTDRDIRIAIQKMPARQQRIAYDWLQRHGTAEQRAAFSNYYNPRAR